MTMWFEDFAVGQRFETPGATLSEAQILDFAFQYDPQPFHIDRPAAEAGPFGGLISSGFQTLAVSFRLTYQLGLIAESGMGAFGMDELRWQQPVRPGDTLKVVLSVLEVRESGSKPDRGFVTFGYETFNQNGEKVMSFKAAQIVRRRPA